MKLFQKIYDFSNSEKLTNRFIFWGILVFINAFWGFFWGLGYDTLGKVLGIITWLFLYVFVFGKGYIKLKNTNFKKSLLSSYLIKTFFAIIFIGAYLDLFVGAFSTGVSDFLFKFFRIEDYYSIYINPFFEDNFFYTYLTTLIHGGILSVLTLLFGYFLHLISRLWIYLWNNFGKNNKNIG